MCYAALRYAGELHNCPTMPTFVKCGFCEQWVEFPADWPHDCQNEQPPNEDPDTNAPEPSPALSSSTTDEQDAWSTTATISDSEGTALPSPLPPPPQLTLAVIPMSSQELDHVFHFLRLAAATWQPPVFNPAEEIPQLENWDDISEDDIPPLEDWDESQDPEE